MQTTTKGLTDNDLMNFTDWIKAYNEDWPQRLSVSRLMLLLSPEERYTVFLTAARLVYGIAQSDRAAIDTAEEPELEGEAVTGDAGDFLLCVESEGMAPAFHAGDVLTIRRAAFTPEMQTHGAVICQGGRYVLGRVAIEKDGSGTLYNGSGAIHFDADDFIGYAIAVKRDL